MTDFFANFHFIRPWLLILLALPIIIYIKYYKNVRNRSSWERVCDEHLLNYLLVKGSFSTNRYWSYIAFWGVFLGIIGAAGPSWQKQEVPIFAAENPVMILLNVSSDMEDTDISPNRLERAKYKIRDLLDELKSVQVGLVVYSSEPFLISPITQDTKLIENLLKEINFNIMPVNGNRLDRAILYAQEKLQNSGYKQGHILIFSADSGSEFQKSLNIANEVHNNGYIIDVDITSKQDSETLRLIAQRGGGKSFLLSSNDKDIKYFSNVINQQNNNLKDIEDKRTIWFDDGYYLSFICLFLALLFFRRGVLYILFLTFFNVNTANANIFQNSNQTGLELYNKGEYKKAAETFNNSKWQGASFYKYGDYGAAYEFFSQNNDVDSIYNQGNALAKSGKIDDAIKKYEEVLKIDENHDDAKFNLEYLKKQQNQSQPPPPNSNNQDGDNKDQQERQDKSAQNKQDNNQAQNNSGQEQNSAQNNQDEQEAENKKNDGTAQPNEEKQQSENANNKQQAPSSDNQTQAEQENEGENLVSTQPKENTNNKSNEEAQARAQQYRDIPEDVGGLLKAFIYKEYQMREANK